MQYAGSTRSSINSVLKQPKFSINSRQQISTKSSAKAKNYSMYKKYMLTNDPDREDKKFAILKKKAHKNSTPVSNSVLVQGKSFDKTNNISQISNRSYLDKSNISQTPRSGVGSRLQNSIGKRSDLSSRFVQRIKFRISQKHTTTPNKRVIPKPKASFSTSIEKKTRTRQKVREIKAKYTPSRNEKIKSHVICTYDNCNSNYLPIARINKMILQPALSKPTTVSSRLRKMKQQGIW